MFDVSECEWWQQPPIVDGVSNDKSSSRQASAAATTAAAVNQNCWGDTSPHSNTATTTPSSSSSSSSFIAKATKGNIFQRSLRTLQPQTSNEKPPACALRQLHLRNTSLVGQFPLRRQQFLEFTLLSLLLIFTVFEPANGLTIQVCQNKDCRGRFQKNGQTSSSLVQLLFDLVSPALMVEENVVIETTGCLSECGKGPNICIKREKKEDRIGHRIIDGATAAAELELAGACIHPTLLAAVNVMDRAEKAKDPQEKLKNLNAVIKKLGDTDGLSKSAAQAHAHCLRAQVYLDENLYSQAKSDIQCAITINSATDGVIPLPSTAWRILADAEEATGSFDKAIEALRKWAESDPKFASKVASEISRLQR